jgi:stress response protein YsnF
VVDEPEYIEKVDVERVPVNQQIESPLRPRYEGETLIIPVMEEVLVVERRLMLKEEIRVTKRRQTVHNPQRVILRSEEILVERIPGEKEE